MRKFHLEVDEALLRHPAIAEAAAFSISHPRLGEDVAAAVVLRPGMTATAIEICKYLQENLAPFKVPRRISFYERLPKGSTGKVLRRRSDRRIGKRRLDRRTRC